MPNNINIVEASIDELQDALTSGALSSVELVARYLRRISTYDCRGIVLNSIPVLNNAVFDEAAASDDRRAAGQAVRPLEGIPYTVKDSYMVRGMTVACGSPAFEHLIAGNDAFTVDAIRKAGGVLIGRTNMPPMAYGGMQRGIYGRAESPYNLDYLAAAFWSGSSNGSGVSTAASFAAFGMGEETVSSGRAPASNNALIAYTPSRGWLSIRGNWPLYPTCDVVVPHTRTMRDMLTLLDTIAAEDSTTDGDFWRDQTFVPIEKPWTSRPESFRELEPYQSLAGVRIAVPALYIGGETPVGATPVTTSDEVVKLWQQTRKELEALGAEVIIVPDFPAVTGYENPDLLPDGCPRLPEDWQSAERGRIIAHGWNNFLLRNKDPKMPDISTVDLLNIYPESMRTPAEMPNFDKKNAVHFPRLKEYASESTIYGVDMFPDAVKALEGMRRILLEDWLDSYGCHCVAFPAAGDVAPADADSNFESGRYARQNGVFYSNGNRALRHLGIPSVSVPMGVMEKKRMPVNLTFAGKAYSDVDLLRYGNAFERKTHHRMPPPLTPALPSDTIQVKHVNGDQNGHHASSRPILTVEKCETLHNTSDKGSPSVEVNISGTIQVMEPGDNGPAPELEVTVDAVDIPSAQVQIEQQPQSADGQRIFSFRASTQMPKPSRNPERPPTMAPVAQDKIMVVVLARATKGGRPSGWLQMI